MLPLFPPHTPPEDTAEDWRPTSGSYVPLFVHVLGITNDKGHQACDCVVMSPKVPKSYPTLCWGPSTYWVTSSNVPASNGFFQHPSRVCFFPPSTILAPLLHIPAPLWFICCNYVNLYSTFSRITKQQAYYWSSAEVCCMNGIMAHTEFTLNHIAF